MKALSRVLAFFVLPQVGSLLLSFNSCASPITTVGANSTQAEEETVDPAATAHTAVVKEWQEELNAQYRDPEHSPLPEADRASFNEHPFFPIDADYQVTARLEYPAEVQILEMPTSSGSIKTFEIYALAHFELHGQELQLQVLKPFGRFSRLNNYLFIPFQDATSGQQTYGGGRYINLPVPSERGDSLVIDFNQAYHPYCAYADGYNCPIPPAENRLPIAVSAGIKLH
ncbi:MAG: DUF1684 domain-containing protein [Bacteroidota bacterium]